MRTLILISTILLFSFSCKQSDTFFPDKQTVLTTEFSNFENFFPIVTLDLSTKGIKDKIHIMYVSFDPDNYNKKYFPENDNIDEFTFNILENDLYQPVFDKSVLIIGERFKEPFEFGKVKYKKAKEKKTYLIEMPDEPEWWQNDITPLNSKGKKMKFICQVDMYELSEDDCRLYIFYDKDDKKVKYIYQRN